MLPQTACASDAHAVTPLLDQLEDAGRLPDELLAEHPDTGDENVAAAAARGVDLIGPVPGRVPASAPEAPTVADFAWDERTGTIDARPAGHRPTSCARRGAVNDAGRDAGVGLRWVPVPEAVSDQRTT